MDANGPRRANWTVCRTTLAAERRTWRRPLPADAALAMMWQLALDAWSSAGRALPDYTRDSMPVSKASLQSPAGSR